MSTFPRARWVNFAFGFAILMLLAVGAISYRGLDASAEAVRWVAHTDEVLRNLSLLREEAENAESGDRLYLLTGDEADLTASRANLAVAFELAGAVRRLTVDNPGQQVRSRALAGLLEQARGAMDAVRTQRQTLSLAAMAQIRSTVQQMSDEESRLLVIRNVHWARTSSLGRIVLILSVMLAVSITLAAAWIVGRDNARRALAEAELRRKVEELARSNEDLGLFAYVASHDLQEPLRAVNGYLKLLARRYKGRLDADADEFINFALDGAARMQTLIQDLLAYSRVGTKDGTLSSVSSEIALRQALVNLAGAITDSGALVTHDTLPLVMADELQLIQLFQNLVGNAIKYQNPGIPRIHVAAVRNDGDKWLFSVSDNGIGIEPQYFEKIFEMFQRLHGRAEFSGTGIGLAICKKIIDRLGGTISVKSQPGQGSTFHFTLTGSESAAPRGRSRKSATRQLTSAQA